MNAQIDKEAGLYTQIRTLRKRIDSLDMRKVDPSELKAAIDSLKDLETRYADMQERKKQRMIDKKNKDTAVDTQTVVSQTPIEPDPSTGVKPEIIPLGASVETKDAAEDSMTQPVPQIDTKPEDMTPKKEEEESPKEKKAEEKSKKRDFQSDHAWALYMKMLDYKLWADDPQYEVIVRFRKAIEKVENEKDREILKEIFNQEFQIHNQTPWDYYAEAKKDIEVNKEADVSKFALDDVVEPVYGTPGSYGRVMRYDADKDLAYVHWDNGKLAEDHGFGAYKGSDLRKRASSDKPICPRCKKESPTKLYMGVCDQCNTEMLEKEFGKEASLNKKARVVERSDGWHVLSEEGKNLGGPYKSKEKAVKRLRQVEYFKHHKASFKFADGEGYPHEVPEVGEEWMHKAMDEIEAGSERAYDLAAEYGQHFDNVKHMKWFVQRLAEEIWYDETDGNTSKPADTSLSDPLENPGEGYGGDRPGVAVAPKASLKTAGKFWTLQGYYPPHGWEDLTSEESREEIMKRKMEYEQNEPGTRLRIKIEYDEPSVQASLKESAKINVANRLWEIVPKYDLSNGGTNLLGYDIYADTGELAGTIKTNHPLSQTVLEQEIWNQLGKSGSVYATLNTNLSVLKKGHKVKIVSVDVKRKEAKFASTEMKSITGWTSLDRFDFSVNAKKPDHNVEDLMPLSKSNVVRVKSVAVLTDLAAKCPDCYKKFLKFAKEKGLRVQADDLSEHVEQMRTKITQTKEHLENQSQAASAPESVETEAALPPKPNIQLPQGMKWLYMMETNTWEMVADDKFTY